MDHAVERGFIVGQNIGNRRLERQSTIELLISLARGARISFPQFSWVRWREFRASAGLMIQTDMLKGLQVMLTFFYSFLSALTAFFISRLFVVLEISIWKLRMVLRM